MNKEDIPIFKKSFELLDWLFDLADQFPKAHRHTFTKRLLDLALEFREKLDEANLETGRQRLECLSEADLALAKVEVFVGLANKKEWLSPEQYQHVSAIVDEIKNLLERC